MLAGAFLLHEYAQERERLQASTTATARALATAVDQQVAVTQAALAALSTSRALTGGDWQTFHAQAVEVARMQNLVVVGLVNPARLPLMNTLQPPGTPLVRPGSADQIGDVFEARRAMVTDVFQGTVLNVPSVAVAVPVVRDGRVAYALVGGIDPGRVAELLRSQQLPPGWVATVVDRSGRIVARSARHDQFLGAKVRQALADQIGKAAEGSMDGTNLAGTRVVTVFTTAATSGWRIVIGIPRGELAAELYQRMAVLASGTAAVLVASLLLALRLRRRLGSTIEVLKDQARQLGRGEPVAEVSTGYAETEQVSAVMRQASGDLHRARNDLLENRRQLQHSEGRLAGIVESALDAIVSIDEAQRIVLFNGAAERMFGWSRQQVLGQPLDLLLPPRFRHAHLAHVQQFAASATATRPMGAGVLAGLRADGTEFPLDASISKVATADGTLFTAIVRDVSDKVRAAADLAAVRADASAMREADKKRVARELHDDVVQTLAAIKLDAAWLLQQPLAPELEQRVRRLIALGDDGVVALRRIAADLRPAALDELGFVAALDDLVETFVERTGVPCELRMDRQLELQDPQATEVFRMVQEALSNIAKHAHARHVRIELDQVGEQLVLRVRDDGVGFDAAAPRRRASLGLAGLRERADILEGSLWIDSRPGAGATVEVRAPAFRRKPR